MASVVTRLVVRWLLLTLLSLGTLRPVSAWQRAGQHSQHSQHSQQQMNRTAARPLVFIHVPKTAGSTVSALFEGMMRELRCARQPLAPADGPPPPAGGVAAAPCVWAHAFAGPDRNDRLFLGRAAMGPANGTAPPLHIDYLIGHLPFGFCPLQNSSMAHECTYTTVLRRPVERLLSHYSYLMRAEPQVVLKECAACGDVDVFARALANGSLHRLQLDNTATRMLSGDGFLSSVSDNRIDDIAWAANGAMLRRAKSNLVSQVSVLGFTEDLPAYVSALRRFLGLPPAAAGAALPVLRAAPPAGGRIDANGLSAATLQRIMRSQAFDLRLYEFARRLARRRGALMLGGGEGGGALADV
jgi:hypothetical protein